MTPHEILAKLKSEGVTLKMRGDKLVGPPDLSEQQQALIRDNRAGLIVALTYQCAVCESPVRLFDRAPKNYWALECIADPLHYSEVLKKAEGVLGLNVPLEEAIEPGAAD